MRKKILKQTIKTETNVPEQGISTNKVMGFKEWGLIIILSILWGGSFLFVGVAVKEIPPFTIVLCRVSLASLILLVVVYSKGERMPYSLKMWGAFFIMGAMNNSIPFSLIVWGQTHIESSLAGILNATTPIFSALLTHFLTNDEKLTVKRICGILIGWIGVILLIGVKSIKGLSFELVGQVAVLGAAFSYACAAIYGRRFKGLDPLIVATGMLCCSGIMMTPFALFIDDPWALSVSIASMASLFALALVSTALAYIIYFRVLVLSGPTNLLLVTFLIPLSAVSFGVLFLGETLGLEAFIGMGTILIGLIAIDGRLLKFFKKENVWFYEI